MAGVAEHQCHDQRLEVFSDKEALASGRRERDFEGKRFLPDKRLNINTSSPEQTGFLFALTTSN